MNKPILTSNRLVLKQPTQDTATEIAQQANNINIWRNVRDSFSFPYTLENANFFINLCQKEDPVTTFAIFYNENFVGMTGLVLQNDIYRNTAEYGFWIGEKFWNKGFASEATTIMIDYGFRQLKLRRIYAGVFDCNNASARVLEKCGFKKEGRLCKAIQKDGKIYDEIRYGIINPDLQ